jgi:Flp pilus assembly protein CpaB
VRPFRRLHLFVARWPPLYWTVVATLAAVPAVVVGLQLTEARRARDGWRDRQPVIVASRSIAPGEELTRADVERREWPRALLPAGSLTELPEPAVAAAPIAAGEPLVAERLGRPAVSATASLVPMGARAVALARGPAPLPLAVGDRVDVVAAAAPDVGDVVATDALVVFVDPGTVVVAVTTAEVPATAAAAAADSAVLALSGAP